MRRALPGGTPERLREVEGGRGSSSLYGATKVTYVQRAGTRCRQDASVRARKAGRRRPAPREREQVPAPQHSATRWKGSTVPMHGLPTATPCSRSAAQ